MDKRDLVERLHGDAQGVDLGADGMGWSPEPGLLREAAAAVERLRAENEGLKRDLQYARDGLTKGRTRMREDIARLVDALKKIEAGNCIDPRTVAREALGPNVNSTAQPAV